MATYKTKVILELCNDLKIEKVVDIGAGLCDILFLLNKSNFGSEYYALEVSPSAVQFIRSNVSIPRLKAVYLLDTNDTRFPDNFFDLGILSHVVEHAVEPAKLLRETLRICTFAIMEVPLENSLTSNIYEWLVEKRTQQKRKDNPIGHINFFNKQTISNLIVSCNGIILRDRNYRLWKTFPKNSHIKNLFATIKSTIFYLTFKIAGSKIVASRYAMLISSLPQTPI